MTTTSSFRVAVLPCERIFVEVTAAAVEVLRAHGQRIVIDVFEPEAAA